MLLDYLNAEAYAYVLAIACIVVGPSIAIGGYRFRRAALFTTALFVSGDYMMQVVLAIGISITSATTYYLLFFSAGLIVGAVAHKGTERGVLITGFCAGVHVTRMILFMVNYCGSDGVMCILYTTGGLVVAPLACYPKRRGLVVATSFIGASLLFDGVSFFVNTDIASGYYRSDWRSRRKVNQREILYSLNNNNGELESAWWTMTAIQLALFVVAVAVQLLLTARNVDHNNVQVETEVPMTDTTQYTKVQTPQPSVKSSSAGSQVSLV